MEGACERVHAFAVQCEGRSKREGEGDAEQRGKERERGQETERPREGPTNRPAGSFGHGDPADSAPLASLTTHRSACTVQVLPPAQQNGIKAYLVKEIINRSQDEATLKKQRQFVRKLNETLICILKHEWSVV